MNYVEQVQTRLKEILPSLDDDLLRLYTLLALVNGTDTTLEDVHDAWSVWKNISHKDHKSLIFFEDLSVEVQELYRKYMDAIHAAS